MIDIGHETWQIFFFSSHIFKRSILCVYKHLVKYSFDIQINKNKLFAQVNVARYIIHHVYMMKMLYSSQNLVLLSKKIMK